MSAFQARFRDLFRDSLDWIERGEGRLDGFLNLAGSQTAGADFNSLNRAVFHDFYALQIGIELPGADVMSM